jgi:Flp pilus assembly protein TadD
VAVEESQLVGPDVLLALFCGWGLVAATRIVERGDRSDYLRCGLFLGLAAAAKYPGAFLVVPLAAAHVVRAARRGEGPAGALLAPRVGEALLAALLVFAAASPYVLLDAGAALRDLGFERHHMAVGHLGREQGRAWSFYLAHALPHGWTPPVLLAAAAGGAWLLARRGTRAVALPGAFFLGAVLGVLGSWTMAAPRYALPLVPLAAAWAAVAAAAIPRRLVPGSAGAALGGAVLVLLAVWPAARSVHDVAFKGRPDSRRAAEAWIEEHVPEGAAILVERYGPEPDPDRYLVLYLPFHGVDPHLYDGAYWPTLYTTFDVVVLSSGVSSRYQAKPEEYPWQVAFYRSLGRAFEERALFAPGRYLGPEIRVLVRREAGTLPDASRLSPEFFTSLRGNTPMAEYVSTLGTVLVRQGETDLGFRLLQFAVEMDASSARAWGNLGSMRLRTGDFEGALLAFRQATEKDPEDARAWTNLGTLYARMGEPRQAADAYDRAIALGPELEDAYLGLARALVEDDRYARARGVLQEFIRRFPRSAKRGAAERALAELASLGPGRP